jgi:hypothetical protein
VLVNPPQWIKKYWLIGLILTSIIIFQIIPGPRAFDDAYITYRYSLNISSGNGFTYNPGEKVLGTTTPLYTLILVALSLITRAKEFPILSLYVNSIADIASVLMLVRIVSGLKYPKYLAIIIGMAYLYNPLRMGISRGGMETPLVVFIILAALYAYVIRKDNTCAAILSGVAFLTRPDTFLLPLLFATFQVFRSRRLPLKEGLILLFITGPWLLFSSLYFGSFVPQSIIAKSSAYLLNSLQGITSFMGYIATRTPLRNLGWPLWVIGVSILLNIWLFIIGSISIFKNNSRSLIIVLYPIIYSLALMIANPLLFVWYFLPFSILFDSLIIVGIFSLTVNIRSFPSAIITVFSLFFLLFIEWKALDQPNDGISVNLRDHEALYEIAGKFLQDEIIEGSTLAMPEIGVLGYIFPESRVIDTVGIVTPEATKYLYRSLQNGQRFSYAIPIDLILELKPDYLLSLDVFFHPNLSSTKAFLNRYKVIGVIPTEAMGSNGFYIFKRIQRGVDK